MENVVAHGNDAQLKLRHNGGEPKEREPAVPKSPETVEKTDPELKNNFTAGIVRSVFDAS